MHDWLNPKRERRLPLFFAVPVTKIWTDPAFVAQYKAKVPNPMDTTTLECKLLSNPPGFRSLAEFLDAAMSIFENAMKANRESYEANDTDGILYCAAGEHLTKYVRYSSCEFFAPLGYGKEGAWDFSPEGAKATRDEMNGKFMHPTGSGWEVSMDPNRKELYQWGEKEILKILKVLKSNKHAKDMKSFYAPQYPVDYDLYISRRCDVYIVEEKVRRRFFNGTGF